jgi:hypothetical protein
MATSASSSSPATVAVTAPATVSTPVATTPVATAPPVPTCPACTTNGTCNTATGTCTCQSGWTGPTCGTVSVSGAQCTVDCPSGQSCSGGAGTLASPGSCTPNVATGTFNTTGMKVTLVMGALIITLISIFIAHRKFPVIKRYYQQKIKGQNVAPLIEKDEPSPEHAKSFEFAFLLVKVGLLMILLISTITYQYNYGNVSYAQTYFGGGSQYAWRPIVDGLITAILGGISVAVVIKGRGQSLKKWWPTVLLVMAVLGVFVISQESSGFNRYMAKTEIANGQSNYYTIDSQSGTSSQQIANVEQGGDPFINSFSNTIIIMMAIVGIICIGIMLKSTWTGFKSGEFKISDIDFKIPGGFKLEWLLMVGLNTLAPMLSPLIRGESFNTSSTWTNVALFFVISLFLHVMFQYNGLYEMWTDHIIKA